MANWEPSICGEDAEPRAGHGLQRGAVTLACGRVLAVSEEHEVVGAQPVQQRHSLADLVLGVAGDPVLRELDHAVDAIDHRVEVAHAQPHVAEHPRHRLGEVVQLVVGHAPVDLEVHHRFAVQRAAGRPDRPHPALVGALHPHHRVHDVADVETAAAQRLAHGVDQERGVGGVGLDHRAGGAVAVPVDGGVDRPHAHVTAAGIDEPVQTAHLRCQLDRVGRLQPVEPHPVRVGLGEHRQRAFADVKLGQERRNQLGVGVAGRSRNGRCCLTAHVR